MSKTELDRVSVIQSIIERRLTQARAARQLHLGVRQVKRLTRAYRACGVAGLASKRRGRCPGNTIGDDVRQQSLAIIKAHYGDFGPTFAHEKLTELHDYHFSVETLRKWMIKDGGWGNSVKPHQSIKADRAGLGLVNWYRLMDHPMIGLMGVLRAAL